ncbi:RluA family pseudouridine synthase [Pseudogracilibacillus auburnensis]|uniref:RluA family pseudouridine synthase n=1 Tax=Pseudogracilibacillus auburnensis TaxID=1494959 RepID=UPI001A976265|nr:RluA family pseudouridine synthase [Pseudogracilibacillus auburnensis]MBO1003548.1 RluA family pseudouridine synthase [Pseudogracilibacillus auburnensis]
MNIPILYEDNHLLIVEKPVNMPVQQDRTNDRDLLNLLKEDIKIRYNKRGNVYLSLIHRLDRPVGGAIVFAKTSKAASRMSSLLRKREIHRTYLAVVRGYVKKEEETLEHYLRKNRKVNQVFAVQPHVNDAKQAILHYKVLERKNNLTLLHIKLQTGRSHQIRVQLKAIGHPLYGDQKYGAHVNKVGEQIALWANKLSFIHPVKKETITITSMPNDDGSPWDKWQLVKEIKNEI